MKYCPMCDERYDEEIIRFCTKDGTPLIEEGQPNFTAIPSEAADDVDDAFGEETVIRRNPPTERDPLTEPPPRESERFVIPTTPEPEPQVRHRQTTAYYPPPPPPNTAKTVVLTIIGTLAVLSFGAGMFWMLQPRDDSTSININTNPPNMNGNLNTNLGFDSNFNFNTNANFDTNFNMPDFNINMNVRTPSPTPSPRTTPSPIASPSPIDTPEPTPAVSPTTRPPTNRPPASPAPTGPRPPIMTSNRPPAGNTE